MVKAGAHWVVTFWGLLCVGFIANGATARGVSAEGASVPATASAWVNTEASRARVIAGTATIAGKDARRIYAGLEIELDDGWKTYWRNPGSSGVPPRIEFGGSENLAKAELMFPAPMRITDSDGDIIGYKKHVVFPVALTPIDPSKPIVLKVSAEFGICREVCIPVQPAFGLAVPPDVPPASDGGPLQTALDRVPQAGSEQANAPRLEQVTTTLSGDKPQVVIDARFPGEAAGGDVFLEAPDGLWIPLPQPKGQSENGARRFVVDLTDGAEVSDLKGRRIRVTLVGTKGQSEAAFDMVEAK